MQHLWRRNVFRLTTKWNCPFTTASYSKPCITPACLNIELYMTLAYPFVPCPPEYEVRLKSGPTISIDESTAKMTENTKAIF